LPEGFRRNLLKNCRSFPGLPPAAVGRNPAGLGKDDSSDFFVSGWIAFDPFFAFSGKRVFCFRRRKGFSGKAGFELSRVSRQEGRRGRRTARLGFMVFGFAAWGISGMDPSGFILEKDGVPKSQGD
jgi:hypothetical protein